MFKLNRFLAIVGLSALSATAFAAPLERKLSLNLTVDATQDWRNELQWSKAQSQQRYQIVTHLRSDGRLYAENLLDPDVPKRIKIKNDYYTYQGLLELRQEFGGRLPKPDQVQSVISAESLAGGDSTCIPGVSCTSMSPERFAAIAVLQQTPSDQLERFMQSYEKPGGRWLYFMGYAGCANQLDLRYQAHYAGERAFDRRRKNLKPFEMDWKAATQGTEDEQRGLCKRYVVTVDTKTNDVYFENVYLPAPVGISERKGAGGDERREIEMSPPSEVASWVNDLLLKTTASGSRQQDIRITLPLDGNSTVLGSFDGTAKVSFSWELK